MSARLVFILMSLALSACAGPHSPFGSIEFGSGDGLSSNLNTQGQARNLASTDAGPVSFSPKRQVLHQPADLEVDFSKITGLDRSKPLDLRVQYNGRDVTHAFMRDIQANAIDHNTLHYTYYSLRLNPTRNHDISFYYRASSDEAYTNAKYLPPVCDMFAPFEIITTAPFEPKAEYVTLIKAYSERYGLNPNLLAGLIAQESGFNPTAETWASALGLTQITPLAKSQIEIYNPKLKNYHKRDWRLSPARSIEGGAIYLQFLNDYWADDSAQKILAEHNVTDLKSVILASYNSGAARVKKDIVDADEDWLAQSNLREAFRYVNRVTSYCYHFSGGQE